jgi:hypothetical protein
MGWQSLGAVAYISGVGFWDFPHGQSGHAPKLRRTPPRYGAEDRVGVPQLRADDPRFQNRVATRPLQS